MKIDKIVATPNKSIPFGMFIGLIWMMKTVLAFHLKKNKYLLYKNYTISCEYVVAEMTAGLLYTYSGFYQTHLSLCSEYAVITCGSHSCLWKNWIFKRIFRIGWKSHDTKSV